MFSLLNFPTIFLLFFVLLVQNQVSATLQQLPLIAQLLTNNNSYIFQGAPYSPNDYLIASSYVEQEFCCLSNICYSSWDSGTAVAGTRIGCFLQNKTETNLRSCVCMEGYERIFGPCDGKNECYCGELVSYESIYTRNGIICNKSTMLLAVLYLPLDPSPQVQTKRTGIELTPNDCDNMVNSALLKYGRFTLTCSAPSCRLTLMQDSMHKVVLGSKNETFSLHVCDRYSEDCAMKFRIETDDCISEISVLENSPITLCQDKYKNLIPSSLFHPECYDGALKAWLIFYWVVTSIVAVLLVILLVLLIKCTGCLLCCSTWKTIWPNLFPFHNAINWLAGKLNRHEHVELKETNDDLPDPIIVETLPTGTLYKETENLLSNGPVLNMSRRDKRNLMKQKYAVLCETTYPEVKCDFKVAEKLTKYDEKEIQALIPVDVPTIPREPLHLITNEWKSTYVEQNIFRTTGDTVQLYKFKNNWSTLFPLLYALIFAGITGNAEAAHCSNVNVMQSSTTVCTIVGNLKTCTSNLNLDLTIPGLGSNACYDLLDDSGNLIYKLSIFTKEIGYQYGTNLKYYTTLGRSISTHLATEFSFACKNSCSKCVDINKCVGGSVPFWKKKPSEDHYNYMLNADKFWTNHQCQSWTDGNTDAHYAYQIRPDLGKSAAVFSLSTVEPYAILDIVELTGGVTTKLLDVKVSRGANIPVSFGTLFVESVEPVNLPNLSELSIISYLKEGKLVYLLHHASPLNSGRISEPGEVQCSLPTCKSINKEQYAVSADFTLLPFTLTTRTFRLTYPSTIVNYKTNLPQMVGNWEIYENNGEIYSRSAGSHTVKMHATYTGIVSVNIVNIVPTVSSFGLSCINATGSSNYLQLTYYCSSDTNSCPLKCKALDGVSYTIEHLTCDNGTHNIPSATIPFGCNEMACGDRSVNLECKEIQFVDIVGFEIDASGSIDNGGSSWKFTTPAMKWTSILSTVVVVIIAILIGFVIVKISCKLLR